MVGFQALHMAPVAICRADSHSYSRAFDQCYNPRPTGGSAMNRMTKKVLSQSLFLFFFSLATTGWLAAQAGKTIDFSSLVVVGDSLAAGVQNGSLEDVQQLHGFANVIAGQIPTNLVMPLVPAPGAPNTLELISAGFPPDIQPTPGTLPFLRDDFLDRKSTRL